MPNWTSNQLTVTGTPAQMKRWYKRVRVKGKDGIVTPFSLNAIVPMPPALRLTHKGSTTIYGEDVNNWVDRDGYTSIPVRASVRKFLASLYGNDDWYEWACLHWGTKWDVSQLQATEGKDEAFYQFETAWAMPQPVIVAARKMFPKLVISVSYNNEGEEEDYTY